MSTFAVGSILVLETTAVQYRKVVYEVIAINLGGDNQQDTVELKSLSKLANGKLLVPSEILQDMLTSKRGLSLV